MKIFKSLALVILAASAIQAAFAAEQVMPASTTATAAANTDMTEGEVKKIDKSTNKITLKHGDIKNLDMPGMTMVFKVKDPSVLDTLKAGDKVKFKAEKAEGALFVTDIQVAK